MCQKGEQVQVKLEPKIMDIFTTAGPVGVGAYWLKTAVMESAIMKIDMNFNVVIQLYYKWSNTSK